MGAQESRIDHGFTLEQVHRLELNFTNLQQDFIIQIMSPKSFKDYFRIASDLFEFKTLEFQEKYMLKFPRDKSRDLIMKLILNWTVVNNQVLEYISNQDAGIDQFGEILSQNKIVKEIFYLNLKKSFFRDFKDLSRINGSDLKSDQIWILSQIIQEQDKKEWELIYSTGKNGKNWTIFLEKVVLPESCIILIRDSQDFLFGVYIDQGLCINPKFHGNSRNFLFTLEPKIDFYYSTGLNSNYQYLNSGTQTLPNGIGFGGQLDYFGLFLNTDLCGRCDADPISTTFNNPILSSEKEFTVKSIEIISIRQRETSIEEETESILKNEQDAAFLEISGKRLYTRS